MRCPKRYRRAAHPVGGVAVSEVHDICEEVAGTKGRELWVLCGSLGTDHDLRRSHDLAAGHLHGDDTIVHFLAKRRTQIDRLCTYVRDDRRFEGVLPPAELLAFSRDRETAIRTAILRRGRASFRPMPMATKTTSIAGIMMQFLRKRPVLQPFATQVLGVGAYQGKANQKSRVNLPATAIRYPHGHQKCRSR